MHLYTEGLTIKNFFPILNEQFVSKNFKIIEDRLFGIETLKSLIYQQATSFNTLEERIKGFEEKLIKVQARTNLRLSSNERQIERDRLELSNLASTTSTNMNSLQTQLNNILSLIAYPQSPRTPAPYQPLSPTKIRQPSQYSDAILLLKPLILQQLQEIPADRSNLQDETVDELLKRIASLEEKVGGVEEGLIETKGCVGKVEQEIAKIGRLVNTLSKQKNIVSQSVSAPVQRIVQTKLDQSQLNRLSKQLQKIKQQSDQKHQEQKTILQGNQTTLGVVLQQFKSLKLELQDLQQLREQVNFMQHQKATRQQTKSLKKHIQTLQAKIQALPNADYLISRLQTIIDPQITSHYDAFSTNLKSQLTPIRNKLDYLSRINDNGLAIKMLREQLFAAVGEERQRREELGIQLPARFTVEIVAQTKKVQRRIGEVEDNFRGSLLGKADSLEIEQLRQSFYGSLSELIERINQKFSNKIETKRVLTFHQERIEELFELFTGRREQEQALRGRMAGLVRCISCCRELGETTQRIHKEAQKQTVTKKLSLRRLERTVNKQ